MIPQSLPWDGVTLGLLFGVVTVVVGMAVGEGVCDGVRLGMPDGRVEVGTGGGDVGFEALPELSDTVLCGASIHKK